SAAGDFASAALLGSLQPTTTDREWDPARSDLTVTPISLPAAARTSHSATFVVGDQVGPHGDQGNSRSLRPARWPRSTCPGFMTSSASPVSISSATVLAASRSIALSLRFVGRYPWLATTARTL